MSIFQDVVGSYIFIVVIFCEQDNNKQHVFDMKTMFRDTKLNVLTFRRVVKNHCGPADDVLSVLVYRESLVPPELPVLLEPPECRECLVSVALLVSPESRERE